VDLQIEFRVGVPLRRQLERALRVAIRSGRLAPGSVLAPSRDLADELGVSRGVVVDSYAQLTTEGYLTAKRGSGTRVALLPASGTPPAPRQVSPPAHFRYDMRPGQAEFHVFPRARWKASLVRALRELPDRRLGYASHRGVAELRNAVAAPASACMSCTATAQLTRHLHRRSSSVSRFRVNPS